jgi:TM2 domain-containing membrane protein YozV
MTAAARITIHHRQQNYGPYSLEEAHQMLIAGRVAREDLAWVEGTPDWKPLGTILGIVDLPPLPEERDASTGEAISDRLILPAFLLAFFVGVFGVHRFYVGKTGSGIAMLLLTLTLVGAIVTGIWALVDWIVIVCGGFRDAEGRLLRRWT